jgi:hypothetical protein
MKCNIKIFLALIIIEEGKWNCNVLSGEIECFVGMSVYMKAYFNFLPLNNHQLQVISYHLTHNSAIKLKLKCNPFIQHI